MATQAAIFAATIAGMKRAVKRKSYDSDSDSSIEHLTNRGNKLRKKARFVHEGQLSAPNGPLTYKRKIEHAGYQREIISRNPPLVDEDGYDVDSEDDDERAQAAAISAAEFDPYADIKLENLLVPLTAASDLPDHPTLSKPFTSKTLTDLTRHAGLMVQKEKASLWRIKHLLTRLSGDNTWMPCSTVETPNDFSYFIGDMDMHQDDQLEKATTRVKNHMSNGTLAADAAGPSGRSSIKSATSENALAVAVQKLAGNIGPNPDELLSLTDVAAHTRDLVGINGDSQQKSATLKGTSLQDGPQSANGDGGMDLDVATKTLSNEIPDIEMQSEGVEAGAEDQEGLPAPHRMRTRAQAQAASDNNTVTSQTRSISPESDGLYVHPYFLAPKSSFADRDLGLPAYEAEETRRLLQLYIQKQEEICRGAQRVYEGLMKADQQRKLVLKWCKAEAHIGPNRDMSDGEDWYDKEEWNLDEDLKKGQDEEEEDAATTAKKTRTRRQ